MGYGIWGAVRAPLPISDIRYPISAVLMPDLDLLWLRTLEELGDRAAHEIKDTLNGVSLSLEVVRGRSGASAGRKNPYASSVSDFAATAAAQLELVTERIEDLLSLSRKPREPGDMPITLQSFSA